MNKTEAIEAVKLIRSIMAYTDVSKMLNTFIKAFLKNSVKNPDGHYYLYGNFNIGGTVSGRLSSSDPNLQNLPANSIYAKNIKRCFKAASGRIMAGADFSSLEDRISALTTKDPNKLKVYVDGYDGHSLRAFAYFKNELPGISDTVESINSVADVFPLIRQKSKEPTFLLTYGGTYHGLMNNVGLTKDVALGIESNYHNLYKVSDKWVEDKINEASKVGYVTVAFGLRVRTPILGQTLLNTRVTPYEASSESRTAGNALGQSYGLLNNRAAIEFFERVLVSEYRHDIKIIALIHDAIYLDFPATLGCTQWVNTNLIECMQWQDLPELQHPVVKLGGNLELYPDWASPISIPNGIKRNEIYAACKGKNVP
jgi:DNA polymerase-1